MTFLEENATAMQFDRIQNYYVLQLLSKESSEEWKDHCYIL